MSSVRALICYAALLACTSSKSLSKRGAEEPFLSKNQTIEKFRFITGCNFSANQFPNDTESRAWNFLQTVEPEKINILITNFKMREYICQTENLFYFLRNGLMRLKVKNTIIRKLACYSDSQIVKDESWPHIFSQDWMEIKYAYDCIKNYRPFTLSLMLTCSLTNYSGTTLTVAEFLRDYRERQNQVSEFVGFF